MHIKFNGNFAPDPNIPRMSDAEYARRKREINIANRQVSDAKNAIEKLRQKADKFTEELERERQELLAKYPLIDIDSIR